MGYHVVLRRNGAKVGHFGPFTTKKQAIAQGQALADDAARDVVVSVEPQRKKATTKKKRTNTRRKRTNTRRTRANSTRYYLAQSLNSSHPPLTLLPAFYLDEDSLSTDLTDRGFRYAEFPNTKARVLVLPKRNRRFLKAWDTYVTDFDVYEVETGVKDGAIVTVLGKKHPRIKRLFGDAKILTEMKGNTRRSNPKRGTFKAREYKYYKLGGRRPAKYLVEGRNSLDSLSDTGKKKYVTKKAAKEEVGYSLTSSYAWLSNKERQQARAKQRKNPMRKNSYHVSPNEDPHSFNKPILKKLRSMKSNPASKSILKRIDLANKWIEFAKKHDIWGIDPYMNTSFNGVINYTHKITVSAQKNRATFKYTDGYPKLGKKESETYNLNNTDTYSDTGVSALRYAINSLIIKPIKRGAKDEGITIPASLR